jgi:hypothetical protein
LDRLTVSLPDTLVKRLKRLSRESGLKVSRIVSSALEEHLAERDVSSMEPPIRPTVLWKLKGRSRLMGPSLRLSKQRVGSWRIVELDKLSV